MSLDDYAKRHGLDYESSYARKQREDEERKARLNKDRAVMLNQAVTEHNNQKAMLQKATDIVFNRLPSALAGGLIESARAREEQGISEWSPKAIAAGAKGFGRGLTGKERYS